MKHFFTMQDGCRTPLSRFACRGTNVMVAGGDGALVWAPAGTVVVMVTVSVSVSVAISVDEGTVAV